MGTFAAGEVVLLPFPFSDLSRSKHRPALLLADSGRGDWLACQITSNPYADPLAVETAKELAALWDGRVVAIDVQDEYVVFLEMAASRAER